MRNSYIYILTTQKNTALYTGVTSNLKQRITRHKNLEGSVFTKRYNVTKLVYFEIFNDIRIAIAREKQIKAGSRKKKLDLVNRINPEWKDLFDDLT